VSGVDIVARGLGAQARAQADARVRTLVAAVASGPVWSQTATFRRVVQAVLPPNAIAPNGSLRLRGAIAKFTPFNAGHAWRAVLVQGANSVTIAQNSIGASVAFYPFDHRVQLSDDRRWGWVLNANAMNTASIAAGVLNELSAITGNPVAMGQRTRGNIAFATYSTPPTAETVLIDFNQPVTYAVDLQVQNGDTAEVASLTLEVINPPPGTANTASPLATVQWGTSITEGTGSAPVAGVPMGCVDVLRRTRPGRPLLNAGLGGQTAVQIADRVLACPTMGRHWDAVLDIAVNDGSTDGTLWWNAVRTQIDRVLAYRAGSAGRTLIWNIYPRTDWTTGTAFRTAMDFVNAQLVATYGTMIVDVLTPFIAGGSNGVGPAANYVDTIHPTNAGHAILASATDAAMTARGWG
jgi:hypothetical protein